MVGTRETAATCAPSAAKSACPWKAERVERHRSPSSVSTDASNTSTPCPAASASSEPKPLGTPSSSASPRAGSGSAAPRVSTSSLTARTGPRASAPEPSSCPNLAYSSAVGGACFEAPPMADGSGRLACCGTTRSGLGFSCPKRDSCADAVCSIFCILAFCIIANIWSRVAAGLGAAEAFGALGLSGVGLELLALGFSGSGGATPSRTALARAMRSARSCCLFPPVLESLQLSAATRDGAVETPTRSGSKGVSVRASAAVMSIADCSVYS